MRFLLMALVAAFLVQPALAQTPPADPENTLVIETVHGKINIQLRPDLAPKHVERVKTLAREKFYDGVVFHRVIAGFMAQTGDPTGTGSGGSKLPNLPAEFTATPFVRGIIGMARTSDPNSANSQFFIMFDRSASLDNQYTVLGQVISGMDVADKIKKGSPAANGQVQGPDKMITVRVLKDIR